MYKILKISVGDTSLGKLQNLANPLLPNVSRMGKLFRFSTQSSFFVLYRYVLHFLLFMIWLFFWSLPAQAQNISPKPIEITPEFTERKIGRDISILEDPSGQLTFDQVSELVDVREQFARSTTDDPSFGFTQSAYWARFSLGDTRDQSLPYNDMPLMLTSLCTNRFGRTLVRQ